MRTYVIKTNKHNIKRNRIDLVPVKGTVLLLDLV